MTAKELIQRAFLVAAGLFAAYCGLSLILVIPLEYVGRAFVGAFMLIAASLTLWLGLGKWRHP